MNASSNLHELLTRLKLWRFNREYMIVFGTLKTTLSFLIDIFSFWTNFKARCILYFEYGHFWASHTYLQTISKLQKYKIAMTHSTNLTSKSSKIHQCWNGNILILRRYHPNIKLCCVLYEISLDKAFILKNDSPEQECSLNSGIDFNFWWTLGLLTRKLSYYK